MIELIQEVAIIVVFLLALASWITTVVGLIIGIICALTKFYRQTKPDARARARSVSMIRPLKGVFPELEQNIRSSFLISHTAPLEVIFCVERADDPAIALVKKMQTQYPDVDAKIVIGEKCSNWHTFKDTSNPMVRNMIPGFESARFDHIWICTARVAVNNDILNDLVTHLNDKIKVVHQMPAHVIGPERSLSQRLDVVWGYSNCARGYHFANFFGLPCMTGMSYMIEKKVWDSLGGIRPFGNYIAEDYILSYRLRSEFNLKLKVSNFPTIQTQSTTSLREFIDRHKRWATMRVALQPFTTIIFELPNNPLIYSIMGMYLFRYAWCVFIPKYLAAPGSDPSSLCGSENASFWYFLGFCHLIGWMVLEYLCMVANEHGTLFKKPDLSFVELASSWTLLQVIFPIILVVSLFSKKSVCWAGTEYAFGKLTKAIKQTSDCDSNLPATSNDNNHVEYH